MVLLIIQEPLSQLPLFSDQNYFNRRFGNAEEPAGEALELVKHVWHACPLWPALMHSVKPDTVRFCKQIQLFFMLRWLAGIATGCHRSADGDRVNDIPAKKITIKLVTDSWSKEIHLVSHYHHLKIRDGADMQRKNNKTEARTCTPVLRGTKIKSAGAAADLMENKKLQALIKLFAYSVHINAASDFCFD